MKKLSLIISMLMIAAMLLAACGGGADDQSQTPGVDMTPGAGTEVTDVAPTTDAGAGDMATPTVEAGGEDMATPTVEAGTGGEVATPTVEAGGEVVGTPTVEGGTGAVDETPQAGVPVTGDDECVPNRVSNLSDFVVADAQGNQIGEVESLIVLRDTSAMTVMNDASNGAGADAAQTPAAEGAEATPTVEAGAGNAASTAGQAGSSVAPKVAYVIVDVEDSDNDVAIPFEAFDLQAGMNTGAAGEGTGAAGEAATPTVEAGAGAETTPAAGEGSATEGAGPVAEGACVLTLNVEPDTLTNAPAFDAAELDLTAEDWDEAFTSYWSEQGGVTIPQTGSDQLGAPVVVDDDFAVEIRNLNGDDLGEASEFIIDETTGNVEYVVMAAGGFLGLGERYIPVPIANLQWASEEGGEVDDLGYMVLNTTSDDLENAPSFGSLNELDTTAEGWEADLESFWNNLTNDAGEEPVATPTVQQ